MKDELASFLITKETPEAYIERLAGACQRCNHCCSFDSGIFLDDDIERISKHMGMESNDFKNAFLEPRIIFNKQVHKAKLERRGKPYGRCIFLDDERGCVINEAKPRHCRLSSGCREYGQQLSIWFMLNYLLDRHDAQAVREYAHYLNTHPTIPGGQLEELVPDTEELKRILAHGTLR